MPPLPSPPLPSHRVVKLSSPYLNVIIIIGAIFLYVTVIIIGVDKNIASTDTVDALCQVGGADKKVCRHTKA